MLYVIVRKFRVPYDTTLYRNEYGWVYKTSLAQKYPYYNTALFDCKSLRVHLPDSKVEVCKCDTL